MDVTVDELIFIHNKIIEETGGLKGLRDSSVLESAVARPNTNVFGFERYKSVYSKAASILESIALFHPFLDGNKRMAMAAASLYMFINDFDLDFTNQEYEEFMLKVVANKLQVRDIGSWIKEHSSPFIFN